MAVKEKNCLLQYVDENGDTILVYPVTTKDNIDGVDETIPDYWKSHIDQRVDEIRIAMESAGWNKSAFLWYHDSHWSSNNGKSPVLLKYLFKHTGINKTNYGGDIIYAENANLYEMDYLWQWRNAISDLPNHHSVAGNHDDGNEVDARWTDNAIYSMLLAPEETPDIVRGSKFYYYIDCPSERTRYLYLDTATKNNNVLYDDEQKAFIKQALINTPAGWHIVAISHIWLNVNYDVNPPAATGFSYGGKIYLDMFDSYNNRDGDFANCQGTVEFCIGGHSHVDNDYTSTCGIPVILTECDGTYVRSGLSCTAGTITENSVNAIIADYDNKKVNVIRIGRGSSRVVPINHIKPVNYTNVLPLAIDSDGSIYNASVTPGYKANTRASSSGTSSATGWFVTGYIPAKKGDIIRFKNHEYFDISGDGGATSRSSFYFYDSSFNQVSNVSQHPNNLPSEAWNAVYGENGDVIQLTIPSTISNFTYIRINFGYLDENSIITINEEIE